MNGNEKFLPVGTVVRLKGASKSLMITGFCSVSGTDQKMYDYCACLYPEGAVSSEINLLFNHEQIETIFFKGFVSEEEISFKQKLNEMVAKRSVDVSPKQNVITQPQMFSGNAN